MFRKMYQNIISESIREKVAYYRNNVLNFRRLPEDVYFFKKKRVIFIHIPKAAGISMYNAIFKRDSFGHETIRRYEELMSAKDFARSYKFTFVRNPYDRIHSAYYYLKAGGRNRPFDVEYSKMLTEINSFEEFVLKWLSHEKINKIQHFQTQSFYLRNKNSDINFDFIGKFENLDRDFRIISERLDIDKHLVFLNKTKVVKSDYIEAYSREMIDVINNLYHNDFHDLGYKKL